MNTPEYMALGTMRDGRAVRIRALKDDAHRGMGIGKLPMGHLATCG